MNAQLYKREKGKYVKIGFSDGWLGFPCDGVWLVRSTPGCKSSSCIAKILEVPKAYKISELKMRSNVMASAIVEYFDKKKEQWNKDKHFSYNAQEIVDKILEKILIDDRKNQIIISRKLLVEKMIYDKEEIFK